jgi:hypothetical protein
MRNNLTPYELFVRDNASGPPAFRAPEQHGKTIIRLQNATGELDRVTLSDDASGAAITEATVQLILRAGYLRDGDTITVREED